MDELVAKVYCSWGLWVARCPRPDCLGAEHYGHAPATGYVGGLTDQGFRCAGCGLVCRSEWPVNAEDIWAVLSLRPFVNTRNWELTETLEELVLENAQHGLGPVALDAPGVQVVDGRFADRSLVGAGSRFAIGG